MKWRLKPFEVEAERVGTILHASAVGDIAALAKWIREAFANGDMSCDGEWLIYNKRGEEIRCAPDDAWLIKGRAGNVFALPDDNFREAYEPA